MPVRDMLWASERLWALGLNGNHLTDEGARVVAAGLQGHATLRDVGVTFTRLTDVGCEHLAHALHTCGRLRGVYMYTTCSGRVTPAGLHVMRCALPQHAVLIICANVGRYIKTP